MNEMSVIKFSIEGFDLVNEAISSSLILEKLENSNLFSKIGSYIFDQIEDKDGLPEITNFDVSNVNYDSNSLKGRFRLSFQIERTFCCSDMESCKPDYLDVTFYFDQNRYSLDCEASYFNWQLSN